MLGFSVFMGLVVPTWLEDHEDSIQTGNQIVDQILFVLLTTSMFISGLLGFLLDNTIPGTLEERGVVAWRAMSEESLDTRDKRSYDIPFVTKYLTEKTWSKYVPCLPTYQ